MKYYVKEYRAWLALLLLLLIMLNVLLFLDAGLANVSTIYLNVVYLVSVVIFCLWRAGADRKALEQLENARLSPQKQAIMDYFTGQVDELKYDNQKLRVQLEEMKDEQLAWVHEMKTPLTVIKLVTEQMENYPQKSRIEQEWLRLYGLLDQQLYNARLMELEKDSLYEEVDVKQVVISEIKHFRAWCLEKGIGFELDRLEGVVITDAKWLAYIVRQCISNAIKYSDENQTVRIYSTQAPQGHLQLHIKDEGQGIAAHDLPRIFRKSYTGTKGRESSAASGMGLYLSKKAADQLGIKLHIISEVGIGTEVVIRFPLENEYSEITGM